MPSSTDGTNPDARKKNTAVWTLFRQYVWHEKWTLCGGAAAMVVSSLANQALPRLVGLRLDNSTTASSSLSPRNNQNMMMMIPAWMVVLGGGMASMLRTVLLARAEGSIMARLRVQAVTTLLLYKDLQWFQQTSSSNNDDGVADDDDTTADPNATPPTQDNHHSNDNTSDNKTTTANNNTTTSAAVLQVLTADVPEMAACMTTVSVNALRSMSAVVYSVYHMCRLDIQLVGYAVAVLPTVGVVAMGLRKTVQRAHRQADTKAQQAAQFLQERLQHVAVVHAAHRQSAEVQTYQDLTTQHNQAVTTQAWFQGSFMGFTFFASNAALLAVTHRGGQAVSAGRLTAGQLTTFTTYAFLLALGTAGLVSATAKWTKGLRAARRYCELVVPDGQEETRATNPRITFETAASSSSPTDIVANMDSLDVTNLGFTYRSSKQPVLRNISLTLQRGQVVALVGRNGSGKSTLAYLLAGLYPPTLGRIALVSKSDGGTTDLADVDAAVRKHLVQLVPQTTALFDLSIRDNVRYAAPAATSDQIVTALQQANGQGLVDNKSGGWDFVVGPHGSQLSGGERQRLCLARALLANPAVLILDEPTSSLDAEGEAAVADALTACRQQQRALVLITHQAKRLAEVDLILVLQDGEIVERGTYPELVRNKKSVLRQLYPDLT